MKVARTIPEMRLLRKELASHGQVALVPTMGNLHQGHMSLVDTAKKHVGDDGTVLSSIFVNPAQFAPHEDFHAYPRTLDDDLAMLEDAGVHGVFAPRSTAEMYGREVSHSKEIHGKWTTLDGGDTYNVLEGASRPGFFVGVATVVSMLFNIMQPTLAVFGQKDAQQCVVIRKLIHDMHYDIRLVTAPIQRESNGLAMSSRNNYLTRDERERAGAIYDALTSAQDAYNSIADPALDASSLRQLVVAHLEPVMQIDYVSVADRLSLAELDQVDPRHGALLSLAAFYGAKRTRLIDNVELLPLEVDL